MAGQLLGVGGEKLSANPSFSGPLTSKQVTLQYWQIEIEVYKLSLQYCIGLLRLKCTS